MILNSCSFPKRCVLIKALILITYLIETHTTTTTKSREKRKYPISMNEIILNLMNMIYIYRNKTKQNIDEKKKEDSQVHP